MTLSALREELAGIRAHGLAGTNVEGIRIEGGDVVFDFDRSAEDEMRADLQRAELDATEAERENAELSARLDQLMGEPSDAAALSDEINRFRQTASTYAQRCQDAEREITLLRKRKGLEAGYLACYVEVMKYLHNSQDPAAAALVRKIHAYR